MAKKVSNKKKLEQARKDKQNYLAAAISGAIVGGITGQDIGRNESIINQRREVSDRLEDINYRAHTGNLSEKEIEFLSKLSSAGPNAGQDISEKILGAAYTSPRTRKSRIIGGTVGSVLGATPGLVGAYAAHKKVKKLEKRVAEEEAQEKNYSKKDFVEPTEKEISKLTRNQVLSLLDKKNKQVDKDREDYISRKTKRGGIYGALVGAGLGALASGLGSKYIAKSSTKDAIINSVLSGGFGGFAGYHQGRNLAKKNAKSYVKSADEYNNNKVTSKYAKELDRIMRTQGREDDLEAINSERIRNEKKAKSEFKDYLSHNSVLNLGRNSIRIR